MQDHRERRKGNATQWRRAADGNKERTTVNDSEDLEFGETSDEMRFILGKTK